MLFGFLQDKDQTMSSEVVRTGFFTQVWICFRMVSGSGLVVFHPVLSCPVREGRPGFSAGYWICRKLDLKTVSVRNWIKGEVDCTGDYYLFVGIGLDSAFFGWFRILVGRGVSLPFQSTSDTKI